MTLWCSFTCQYATNTLHTSTTPTLSYSISYSCLEPSKTLNLGQPKH